MRIISVAFVAILVSVAGYLCGVPGALLSLPVAGLISVATERMIGKRTPSQSVRRRSL
jgi:predicted PurR-regulated permease PerM